MMSHVRVDPMHSLPGESGVFKKKFVGLTWLYMPQENCMNAHQPIYLGRQLRFYFLLTIFLLAYSAVNSLAIICFNRM